jgi:ubiquinone/menaquinone biosynthesis C-methylase UbiE
MTGFDRLAKPYRWMEYLSFGKALERCRFRFLREMTATQSALLLGDGDGRFAAQLLRFAPLCHLHAVDGSRAMLHALQTRCGAGERVSMYQADIAKGLPAAMSAESFDLVATHFFLDCLTTPETEALVRRVKSLLRPGACWVVSEFDIPRGPMRGPSALIVRTLYVSFRVLTGLRARRLPKYRDAMERHGFACSKRVTTLGGLLVAELWTLDRHAPVTVST